MRIATLTRLLALTLATGVPSPSAHTLRCGAHVRINLLTARLAEPVRRRIECFNALLGAGIACFLAWHVWALALQSLDFQDISPGLLAMPLWIPQTGAAVGVSALAMALIDEFFWRLGGGLSRCEAPDELDGGTPVA